MEKRIEKIKKTLSRFEGLETIPNIFGADKHNFKLNPIKTEDEMVSFEKENQIQLPKEYRLFILKIGNGGTGPNYGLEPIENGKFIDLDKKNPKNLIDLSKPFLYSRPWNLNWNIPIDIQEEEKYYEKLSLEYTDKKHVNGLLRISNFGCGVWINLVVNGYEYGNIWVDDMNSNQGLMPYQTNKKERVQFS